MPRCLAPRVEGRGQPEGPDGTGRDGTGRDGTGRDGAGRAAGLGRWGGCGRRLDRDTGAMEAGGCRYQFRIALLGDAAVGKTSLLRRYVAGAPGAREPEPEPEGEPTVGVEFYSRKLQLRAGPRIKLQLWDTAGHERFRCGPGGLRELAGGTPRGLGLSDPGSLALHAESFVPQMQPGGPSPLNQKPESRRGGGPGC